MKICIIEGHAAILENLRLLLSEEPDITILGCYLNAEDALAEVKWQDVHVLLVDLALPGMPGTELIRRVNDKHPKIRIIVYSIYEDRPTVFEAIRAGACGYILKGCRPSQLIAALHDIHEGGAPMSPSIARIVLFEFQNMTRDQNSSAMLNPILTRRERTILQHLEQGLKYKEIANRLAIATSTVHTHIKNIYGKLHARDKIEAIKKGRH